MKGLRYTGLLLLISVRLAYAQLPVSHIRYNINNGLPSEDLYCSLEDHNGYLWFGSDAGLVRYNGFEFVRYTSNEGLPDNTIFSLHEDAEGRIWIASFSRKIGFLYKGVYHSLYNNTDHTDFITREFVHTTSSDREHVYFNTISKIYYHTKRGGETSIQALPDSSDAEILVLNKRGLWFCIRTNRMIKKEKIAVEIRDEKNNSLRYQLPIHPLETEASICRFRTVGDSLFIISMGGLLITADRLGHYHTLQFDHDVLQLGTNSGGLEVSVQTEGMSFYPGCRIDRPPQRTWFPQSSVTSILTDREGGGWFTTVEEGIFYAPAYHRKILFVPSEVNTKTFFIEHLDNKIWIGNKNGQLCSIPDSIGTHPAFTTYTVPGETRLNFMLKWKNGYFISGRNYTYLFDLRKNTLIQRSSLYGAFRAAIITRDDTCYSVNRMGFYLLDSASYKLLKILPGGECFGLAEYGHYILIGTINGITAFDRNNRRFLEPFPGYRERVDVVRTGPRQSVWMGTRNGGLQVWSAAGLSVYNKENGLVENTITDITFDADSTAYIATKNGISVIRNPLDEEKRTITNFNYMDGIISNEVTCLTPVKNALFIGTNQGMIIIDKNDLVPNPVLPRTYIESIRNLEGDIQGSDFPYYKNDLEFVIGSTSFRSGGKIRMRYTLHDAEKPEYYYQEGSNRITLPDLAPGEYHLCVWTANSSGKWSSEPATFHFTIHKPLWKRYWFLVSALLLFTTALSIAFVIRIRSVRRKEAEKSRLQLTIEEMKMESLRMNMSPHFIFNSLNSIQHYILKNKTSEAYHYLETFATLIRNILDYSQQSFINLEEELSTLKLYIELENLRLENTLEVEYTIDPSIDLMMVNVPPLLIQPFVENSIWHGLMLKESNRRLSIRIQNEGAAIRCIIEDNGVGRKASAERNKLNPKKSFGMEITRKRMDGLKQRNALYNLEILDLYDNGAPAGTRIILTIPNGPYEQRY